MVGAQEMLVRLENGEFDEKTESLRWDSGIDQMEKQLSTPTRIINEAKSEGELTGGVMKSKPLAIRWADVDVQATAHDVPAPPVPVEPKNNPRTTKLLVFHYHRQHRKFEFR